MEEIADILKEYGVSLSVSSTRGWGTHSPNDVGLYWLGTVVASNDKTRLTSTAWAASAEHAVLAAIVGMRRQVLALRELAPS